MVRAMASAPVGDDVYDEDPSIHALENHVADLLGHEAGLFCPTGSMTNMLGLWLHAAPGTEVLCDALAHVARAELGAHAAVHGITTRTWRSAEGRMRVADVTDLVAVNCGPHLVETACVVVEDTVNFAGGVVQDPAEVARLREVLQPLGVKMHLDGARLANAVAVTGEDPATVGSRFDSVSLCLSKGLGAPVGSVLVANRDSIARARVQRKRLGGGWRQAGLLAAAGLYAVTHHWQRVAEDHAHAAGFASLVAERAPGTVDPQRVQTNIVVLAADDAPAVARECEARGVRLSVLGPRQLRAVTHLDVSAQECEQAGRVVGEVLAGHAL